MIPALGLGIGRIGLFYGVASAAIIVVKHRENLARLRAGTENRISLLKPKRT